MRLSYTKHLDALSVIKAHTHVLHRALSGSLMYVLSGILSLALYGALISLLHRWKLVGTT